MKDAWIYVLAVVVFVAVAALKQGKRKSELSFKAKRRLLNQGEQALFERLREAVGEDRFMVLAQVSLSQLFEISRKEPNFYQRLNAVARKSVDFVVCRREDSAIVAVIELNGPTHQSAIQSKSDKTKREALESAGIPMLIYTPDKLPEVTALRKDFAPLVVRQKSEEEKRSRLQK